MFHQHVIAMCLYKSQITWEELRMYFQKIHIRLKKKNFRFSVAAQSHLAQSHLCLGSFKKQYKPTNHFQAV